jgi:uncharacterized protein YqhQ
MMRGAANWAVAVRAPAAGTADDVLSVPQGQINTYHEPLVLWTKRHALLRLPLVRGVAALVQSLGVGFKALGIAANASQPEDAETIGGRGWAATMAVATVAAVCIFFLLPAGIVNLFRDSFPNSIVFVVVEKLIRVAILVCYLWLISRLRDLRRVFEYHGAEHKAISCYEAGLRLTPENAQGFSRLHPRCGTSFLLIVMIVAVVVFAPLGTPPWYLLFASRIIGIPIVAGLAFEVLHVVARHRSSRWARLAMAPGLQLQRLTTREPDLSQLAVAISALETVLALENPAKAGPNERIGMEVVA